MTVPLILLAIPSVAARPGARAAARRRPDPPLARAGLPAGRARCSRGRTSRTQLFGIDGGLILASVTVAVVGMVLAWRYFGIDFGGLRWPARPELVREIERPARPGVPVPRVAQQVVVRRPQPPAVHRHRRADRASASGGSTARSSTAPSTPSVAARSGRRARPPPGPDRPGPELRARHRASG